MKRIVFVAIVLSGLILSSCATNNVASNGLIQKRKHNKGFHLNFPSKVSDNSEVTAKKETSKSQEYEQVVVAESIDNIEEISPIQLRNEMVSVIEVKEQSYIVENQEKSSILKKDNGVKVKKPFENKISAIKLIETKQKTTSTVIDHAIQQGDYLEYKEGNRDNLRVEQILLIVLCFLLPPLAVYLANGPWVLNLILTLLFWIPGVIHALIVVLA